MYSLVFFFLLSSSPSKFSYHFVSICSFEESHRLALALLFYTPNPFNVVQIPGWFVVKHSREVQTIGTPCDVDNSSRMSWKSQIHAWHLKSNRIYIIFLYIVKNVFYFIYTGWPNKNGTVDTVNFSGLCSDQQLSFFTLLDRASLMDCHFRDLPNFQSSEARFMTN